MVNKVTDISRHILPVSSTMVGVCMTVITVMQLVPKGKVASWADDLIAIDGLFFLASTIFSYWSLRSDNNTAKTEAFADRLFLLGMILMVIVSFLVAFELLVN
ncbi:hypothetical protein [Methylotenera versatilis]|uniref:hypothetical protein n=1 Tax=Methylotenera versatilis TaxID=1055487 RepID=UPI000645F20B|nr:hypothetical protein [Methylotenera versatilis]